MQIVLINTTRQQFHGATVLPCNTAICRWWRERGSNTVPFMVRSSFGRMSGYYYYSCYRLTFMAFNDVVSTGEVI